jgi:hypothetical protein
VISFTTSPIRAPASDRFVDALVGGGRLLDGVGRDPVRFLDPAGDFRDRAGELVGGGRRGADMLGGGLGRTGRLAGEPGGGPRGLGELPRDTLEFAGGVQHLVEDAADAGLELVDEAAQFSLALLGGGNGGRGLLLAHPAAFGRVVLEDGEVRAISPISSMRSSQSISTSALPLAIAVSEAVTEVSGLVTRRTISMVSSITSSAAMTGGDRHVLMACAQHGLVVRHRNADIENADHLAGRTIDG